ncbi:MAG: C-terminal helicase domain-containing protein, partial [Polyangiaceae bacterium]
LDWLVRELSMADGLEDLSVVRVVRALPRAHGPRAGDRPPAGTERVPVVTLEALAQGDDSALLLAAAEWVLVDDGLLADAAPYLPFNVRICRDVTQREVLSEDDAFLFRQARWAGGAPPLAQPVRDRGNELTNGTDLEKHEQKWLADHTWAGEVAWRLTREHELRWSKHHEERRKLGKGLRTLLPRAAGVEPAIADVRDIGLPSILEVLQKGIGADRARRSSALMLGIPPRILADRFESLSFQHRMHPTIADFARRMFYEGNALCDANTIASRDAALDWTFAPEDGARRVWLDVLGHERAGVNRAEIDVMCDVLSRFLAWAKEKGPPARGLPRRWEVACLCFYAKQEVAIRERLASFLAQRPRSRYETDLVEIVCGTVDRFQGREADLVLLSMRNTRRIGFLDSPNRLNVALTRARQQLYVIGNARYFGDCRVSELEELVRVTRLRKLPLSPRGKR